MELTFKVYPAMWDSQFDGVKFELVFISNINMAESCITKIMPKDASLDLRKRLLDDMFYELRQRINEKEDAFDNLLKAIKEASK